MRVFFFAFLAVTLLSGGAFAKSGTKITEKMITDKYAALEKALNDRDSYTKAIRLMHEQISDDATFRLTVTNPDSDNSGKSPVMEMNKQDYINTYIQGSHFIADYHMAIQSFGFEYDPATDEAETVDVMTESGMMPTQFNDKGKPFVSRTTCHTRHAMRQGSLVATGSECHTDITFEEEI